MHTSLSKSHKQHRNILIYQGAELLIPPSVVRTFVASQLGPLPRDPFNITTEVQQLVSTIDELLERKCSGSGL
jgi:hypothetical protein